MLHFALAAFFLTAPASAQAAAQYNLIMSVSGQIPIAGVNKPLAVTVTRKNVPLPQARAVFCSAAANFHTTQQGGYQWKVSKCTYNKVTHVGQTTLQGTVRLVGLKKPMNLNVVYRYVKAAPKGGSVAAIAKGNSDLIIKVNGKFNLLGWKGFASSVMRRNLNKPASRTSFCSAAQNFTGGANWQVKGCSYNPATGRGRVVHVGKFNSNGALIPVRFTANYVYVNSLARPVLVGQASKGRNILRWAPVRGARGYTVYRQAPGQGMRIYRKLGRVARFVDRQVQRGKLYTYAVVATNALTYSLRSNKVTLRAR
ncbi:MAG: hypothetical protein D6703_04740 [Zetaproteobacteria bacterium]|nr:MAG: hypothetical protein D6703_04740 [Zetaproteobacteria bacterium]